MTTATLLVFARALGLVSRAPGFSHPSVPAMVRLAFALVLALAIAPASTVREPSGVLLLLAFAGEVALGAAMGIGASVLCDAAYFAGRTVDDYLGMRGSVPNANVASAQGFGRLWSSSFLASFLFLDGFVPVLSGFAASFASIPAGTFARGADWLGFALALPVTIVRAAVGIAAPAIAVAAVVQFAFAAIARVVPRMTTLTLAAPAAFAVALVVTAIAVPLVSASGGRPLLVWPVHAR